MKIVRDFFPDPEVGGWVPAWIPEEAGFTGTSTNFIIHDTLEHRLCDTGQFHEEVMAFGRMLALRVQPGIIQPTWGSRAATVDLGAELANLFSGTSERDLAPAPAYEPHDDVVDEVRQLANAMRFEHGLSERYSPSREQVRRGFWGDVIAWLHIGYRDALRRYGGSDGCSRLGWDFSNYMDFQARSIDRKEEGPRVLRIIVDLCRETGRAKVRHYIRENEELSWQTRQKVERFLWARG
jgi:hypothetical protein